nr:hypothetical protein [Tanacetum cinerariifolium]
MHRQPDQGMTYLLAELGTRGTLDGWQRLMTFAHKFTITDEYVTCNTYKSPDTSLSRENRLLLPRCKKSHSEKYGMNRAIKLIHGEMTMLHILNY